MLEIYWTNIQVNSSTLELFVKYEHIYMKKRTKRSKTERHILVKF